MRRNRQAEEETFWTLACAAIGLAALVAIFAFLNSIL